jgi:hypothetical protein
MATAQLECGVRSWERLKMELLKGLKLKPMRRKGRKGFGKTGNMFIFFRNVA